MLCIAALLRPVYGIFGYIWFTLMRPDVLSYSVGAYPYSLAIAICTLVGSLLYVSGVFRLFTNPFALLLLALQVPIALSTAFAVNRGLAMPSFVLFERAMLMAFMILVLIDDLSEFKTLLIVMGASIGALGLKFGLFGLQAGGTQFTRGIGGMTSDNNTFAIALLMGMPLCWYCRELVTSKYVRLGLLAMFAGCIVTVIMTSSRAAAIGLVVEFALIIWRSKHRVAMLVVAALLSLPVVYLVADSFLSRMSTLEDPYADASARTRLEQVGESIKVWRESPWVGVGFGGENYLLVSAKFVDRPILNVVHNTYLESLADSGIFAFLLYLTLLAAQLIYLSWSIRKLRAVRPDLVFYPMMLQTSLIGFAVPATFQPRFSYDFYYILVVCVAVWYRLQKELLVQPAPEQQQVVEETGEPVVRWL